MKIFIGLRNAAWMTVAAFFLASPILMTHGVAQQGNPSGEPLYRALEREGLLTPQQTWLVRVGEESGSLAQHMDTVVAQERRDEMFRGRLIAAMLYPVTVLVIAIITLIVAFIYPDLDRLGKHQVRYGRP